MVCYLIKGSEDKHYKKYLLQFGKHFNEKLYNFAISLMDHGKKSLQKNQIDSILKANDITLDRQFGWDYVFVANMAYNDFFESSIKDEQHLALFIKDYIDDADGYDELPFSRWIADMSYKNIQIDWNSMI